MVFPGNISEENTQYRIGFFYNINGKASQSLADFIGVEKKIACLDWS